MKQERRFYTHDTQSGGLTAPEKPQYRIIMVDRQSFFEGLGPKARFFVNNLDGNKKKQFEKAGLQTDATDGMFVLGFPFKWNNDRNSYSIIPIRIPYTTQPDEQLFNAAIPASELFPQVANYLDTILQIIIQKNGQLPSTITDTIKKASQAFTVLSKLIGDTVVDLRTQYNTEQHTFKVTGIQ